jgi:hypothetical protein
VAQHQIVRRLLEGGCPDNMIKPLKLMDSNIASTIGACLLNMGRLEAATGYFAHARRAGHQAGNPTYGAYAAINTSFAALWTLRLLRAAWPHAPMMVGSKPSQKSKPPAPLR